MALRDTPRTRASGKQPHAQPSPASAALLRACWDGQPGPATGSGTPRHAACEAARRARARRAVRSGRAQTNKGEAAGAAHLRMSSSPLKSLALARHCAATSSCPDVMASSPCTHPVRVAGPKRATLLLRLSRRGGSERWREPRASRGAHQLLPLGLRVDLLGDARGHLEVAQLDGQLEAVVGVHRRVERLAHEALGLEEARHAVERVLGQLRVGSCGKARRRKGRGGSRGTFAGRCTGGTREGRGTKLRPGAELRDTRSGPAAAPSEVAVACAANGPAERAQSGCLVDLTWGTSASAPSTLPRMTSVLNSIMDSSSV